jgi:hypothetical protein
VSDEPTVAQTIEQDHEQQERKPYASPRLVELGRVEEMTLGGASFIVG